MSEPTKCPECGSTLPPDAPAGLCPSCLGRAVLADSATIGPPNHRPAEHSNDYADFRRAVLELGVIDAAELDRLADNVSQNLSRLSDLLTRAGTLTLYQVGAIRQGKSRGLIIGEYLVLEKIGQGGMGVVFKATQLQTRRVVALKILPPSIGRDADVVRRFRREFEIAARLNHPNIVSAIDASEDRGVQFLTMEYVTGHDLDDLVSDVGPLPLKLALHSVIQAATGLAAAHSSGIVHRDIKPSNLILDATGQIKVLDLGLARLVERSSGFGEAGATSLTQTGSLMGTIDFIAPEQADDSKRADHRADIYSLGCTLYFLLTGRPPFEEETALRRLMAHQRRPAPKLIAQRPEVPASLESVYQAMMAKRPSDRLQSMTEVIEKLEACRSSPDDAKEARASFMEFAEKALKRAAPRRRGLGTKASVFDRPVEGRDPSINPDLRFEDLVMDFRKEIPHEPLREDQLPPLLPRIAAAPKSVRRPPSKAATITLAGIIGLFGVGGWLMVRKPSQTLTDNKPDAGSVQKDPVAVVDHVKLGRTLYEQGKYEDALAEFREAIRLSPDDAEAHFYLGRCYASLKKFEEALATYRKALVVKPDYAEVYVRMGRVLLNQGKRDDAINACREAIRLQPTLDLAHRDMGIVLNAMGKKDEALTELREAVRLKPDIPGYRGDLGFFLREKGMLDESAAELREAHRLAPEDSAILYYQGLTSEAQGKLEEAIASYREADRIDAKRKRLESAAYRLTELLRKVGRKDEAISALKEFVHRDPNVPEIHWELADMLGAKRMFDEAITEFYAVIKLMPDRRSAHADLGNLFARLGRWNEALKELARALELDPSNQFIALQVGTLYLQLGDEVGYRQHALTVIERLSAVPQAAGVVAKCCLMNGKTVEIDRATQIARAAYKRVVDANPKIDNFGWCQLDVALAEYRNGRYVVAADLLRKCRKSGGILEVQASMLLAMACFRLDRKNEASRLLSDYTKALQKGIDAYDTGDVWHQWWFNAWHDWLAADLFRREAEALKDASASRPAVGKTANPTNARTPAP